MLTQKIKSLINKLGYDLTKIKSNQFTIGDIDYIAEPYSVGQTPQGETTAKGAIRIIKERELKELKVLDICCGVGIIGLTIFSNLKKGGIVNETSFVDINIFNLNSFKKTIRQNNLQDLMGSQLQCYLSDGLSNVPTTEKFDIIVSNPPHYIIPEFDQDNTSLTTSRLATYDAGWNFHKEFYKQCHNYLTDRGEIWFLENSSGAEEKDLLPFIEANEKLQYVEMFDEPLDPRFFWMITKKA